MIKLFEWKLVNDVNFNSKMHRWIVENALDAHFTGLSCRQGVLDNSKAYIVAAIIIHITYPIELVITVYIVLKAS